MVVLTIKCAFDSHTQHEIVEPAVRIVGNIFRGSDSQIQVHLVFVHSL